MMGEDVLIARALLEAGYTIVYDAQATVDHSHDYGPEKMFWRGQVDGKFNVEWMQRVCIGGEADITWLTNQLVAEDVGVLVAGLGRFLPGLIEHRDQVGPHREIQCV